MPFDSTIAMVNQYVEMFDVDHSYSPVDTTMAMVSQYVKMFDVDYSYACQMTVQWQSRSV